MAASFLERGFKEGNYHLVVFTRLGNVLCMPRMDVEFPAVRIPHLPEGASLLTPADSQAVETVYDVHERRDIVEKRCPVCGRHTYVRYEYVSTGPR